jgi:hypothetical protein
MNFFVRTVLFLFIPVVFSCGSHQDRFNVDVSKIKVEKFNIKRYERALFSVDRDHLKSGLEKLQPEFPMFLDGDLNDTLNLIRISNYLNDTVLTATSKDCEHIFSSLSGLEEELTNAFVHYRYYFPDRPQPAVYTYISGFDYENPVRLYENSLLIALDIYLGAEYHRYKNLGLPQYILHRFTKDNIAGDCMKEMARNESDSRRVGPDLLDLMVNEGKTLWYCKAMIPDIPDSTLLDFSKKQLIWVDENEGNVWAFIIENRMLYSQDMQNIKKLIGEAPFTSFFGDDSPPRLGHYIGWRIIESYMNKNPKITLAELMNSYDAQEVLNNSGYKPGL